jgi:hypothetical protein
MNRKLLNHIGFWTSWFAVLTQFILMLQNRQTPYLETIIRFFSFFTILTNTIVALYFTVQLIPLKKNPLNFLNKNGALTAITVFILLVGIVYQIVLRSIWEPKGLQKIVDELLHSFIPLFVFIYWLFYSKREDLNFITFLKWLSYPVLYFIFIITRGLASGFYPYPFMNVDELGLSKIGINFVLITTTILILFVILVFIGQKKNIKQKTS